MKKLLLLIITLCLFKVNYSTHVMGADIEYSCRGKDTFDFIVKVYKDCKGVSLSPIQMNIDGVGCSYSSSYTMTQILCQDITPVCKKSCSKCDRTNCNSYGYPNGGNANCTFPYGIEKLVFKQTIIFKGTNCCKFRVSYSQCCRNGAITTCCAGDNFYSYALFNRCLTPCNSSPTLSNDPVGMYCVGNCICFNNGAKDTSNYDSISYHLAPALSDYGVNCIYQGSYTYKYPLYYDGFPSIKKFNDKTCKGFGLDSITGDLCFKPMQQQVSVIAIEIKEWRKDSLGKMINIGTTRRDMQLIIMANCTNKAPSLPSATQVGCAGDLICFSGIKSSDPDKKDTVLLTWNYGIPKGVFKAKFNGSGKQEFDFCWQTVDKDASNTPYFFTVKAIDDACPLSGQFSRSYSILVKKNPQINRVYINIGCGYLNMNAVPININKAKEIFTYQWTVPFPGGVKYNIQDTTIHFNSSGMKIIKCEVTLNGCSNYFIDTVNIPPFISLTLPEDTTVCNESIYNIKTKITNGIKPFKYNWYINNINQSDTSDNISLKILNKTIVICKVMDSINCISIDTILIDVDNKPNFIFPIIRRCYNSSQDIIYSKAIDSNNQQVNGIFKYRYEQDTTNINNLLLYTYKLNPNSVNNLNYINSLFISNNGCLYRDSFQIQIDTLPKIQLKDTILCIDNGLFSLFKYGFPKLYSSDTWIGNGIVNTNNKWYFDPIKAGIGKHILLHNVEDGNTCHGMDSCVFNVLPLPKIQLNKLNVCVNDVIDSLMEKIVKSTDYTVKLTSPYIINNTFKSTTSGLFKVMIYFTNITGCGNIDSTYIQVNLLPNINISFNDTICDFESITTLHSDRIGAWFVNGSKSDSIINVSNLNYGHNDIEYYYKDLITNCSVDTMFLISKINTPQLELDGRDICSNEIFNFNLIQNYTNKGFVQINNKFYQGSYYPTQQDINNKQFTVWYGDSTSFCKVLKSKIINIFPRPKLNINLPKGCEPLNINLTLNIDTNIDISYKIDNIWYNLNNINAIIYNKTDSIKEIYNVEFYIKNKITGCDTNIILYGEVYKRSKADFKIYPSKIINRNPGKVYFKNLSTYSDSFLWIVPDSFFTKDIINYYSDTIKYNGYIYIITLQTNNKYNCRDNYIDTLRILPNMVVFIPNTFTPNNYGSDKNNRFWVEASNYKDFEIYIFNRWGENVYYSKERLPGWDGNFKNDPCQVDIYVYQVNIQDINGKWYSLNGTITLLR